MYICLMYSKELLKGTLQTIVLNLLVQHGKMYGYEITQKVKLLTDNHIVLTEGALYPSLHKMEGQGLLSTEKVKTGKRVRKYYIPTKVGFETAKAKKQEFRSFARTMDLLLNAKGKMT
jgi:PadR family transcriptional regulator PadR